MPMKFDECAQRYMRNATLQTLWGWNGTIIGIARNHTTQISREGCLHVCGTGTNYYPWKDVSSTITTWLLPCVGTLLQAPFESNATGRTFLAIARWVGSPIASLSYVLWNIKVSAKAALMVDMAVKYDETPDRKTDFGSMRDSMFLLLVMNQYTLKPSRALKEKEAEGLLRITLFSKDLRLTDTDKSLRHMRRILARELREMRRRGAVPVFVSIMWFLFAFALSVEGAFGNLGENTTAHDLALGCLLAWFPVLIMASIVDRNPIATDAIKKKLNALVDHVRHALRDEENRKKFVNSFHDQPNFEQLKVWVDDVAEKGEEMFDFFEDFAGQARVRWHYGAAHPILSDIENCYIADKGRNWLAREREARSHLVLGPINDEGLLWFDIREFWQIWSAIIIVLGSCGGAFILSYFTPTVGLGCRSGGYTIFFSIALGLLCVEMSVWLVLSPYEVDAAWMRKTATRLHSNATFTHLEGNAQDRWRKLKRRASSFLLATENRVAKCAIWVALLLPWKNKHRVKNKVREGVEEIFSDLRNMSPQRRWDLFFFRPIEAFNAMYLVGIVLAQTFGWYKTCACVTSTWGGGGGYLDFSVQDTSNSRWVFIYWMAGTILTTMVMSASMFYITVEWCQQSFLSTENYNDAMRGLQMTRSYRSFTFLIRRVVRFISRFSFDPLERLGVTVGLIKTRQKTLLWTRDHTWDPPVPAKSEPEPEFGSITHSGHSHMRASPSIELTDYSTVPLSDNPVYETPAMAHSLFPPAISTRRPRNQSDASAYDPRLPIYEQNRLRFSEDSADPLIQRPVDVHRSRASRQRRTSNDSQRGSDDTDSGPDATATTPLDVSRPEQSIHGAWLGSTLQSRQGYRRANSDPGSPPIDLAASVTIPGLGIYTSDGIENVGQDSGGRA